MTLNKNTPATKKIAKLLHQELPEVRLIYLFGSQASGQATDSSDWDIAVLCQQPLDNIVRWNTAQTLASVLDRDVDLVDLLEASTVLQMQVVSQGKLLNGDEQSVHVFETQVYSMYAHLQESRQNIIDQFIGTLKNGLNNG
jgi:predicted nucleotidyltransferase